jgi:hypothetical protein
LSDPQIPQQASVEKQLKKRSLQKKGVVSPDNFTILPSGCKRRCILCMDAGWDGNDQGCTPYHITVTAVHLMGQDRFTCSVSILYTNLP